MPAGTNYGNVPGFGTSLASFPLKASACTGSNGVGLLVAHETREKLERMVARRAVALGECNWPTPSHVWANGAVTAIDYGLITTDQTWHGGSDDTSGNTYADPWAGVIVNSPRTDFIPSNWWWVLDHPLYDWAKCLKGQVLDWTNTGTVTIDPKILWAAVQCCVIPSLAYLVSAGFTLKVIARDAIWRSDRVLEWPNDPQFATGNVQAYPANTNVTPALPATPTLVAGPGTNSTLIFRHTNVASFAALAGMDFRTTDAAGYVQSWQFSSSSTAGVGYAVGAGTANANAGSAFTVVHHGARGVPGRGPSFPYNAYRGMVGGYPTHDFRSATLGAAAASMPIKTTKVEVELPGPTCGFTNQQVYDLDYMTTFDGGEDGGSYTDCGRPYDKIYAPDFHKTVHGLQVDVLAMSAGYTEDKDWTGLRAATIPNFNQAECARVAATNLAGVSGVAQTFDLFTLSTGSLVSSGEINVSGSGTNVLPYLPIGAWYSIRRADGSLNGGYGVFGTNGTLVAGPGGPGNGASGLFTSGTDESRQVLVWPGFSLFVRNQVRGIRDQPGVFIPDVEVPDVGDPFAVDPPAPISYTSSGSFGVGQFVARAKSKHATDRLVYDADPGAVQGFAREGFGTNTLLVTDGLYRQNGDAFFAPSVKASDAGAFLTADDPQAPYYERFWNGRLSDAHQPIRDGLRSGTVSAGGTNWLRAPSCDWFTDPLAGGVLYVNGGTVTTGSSTSFADSVAGNPSNSKSAYFAAIRFPGFGGSYVTFPIELDFGSGTYRGTFNPQFTEARLLATGTTNATGTWLTPLTNGSCAGVPWRIREPRVLHPVYGCKMLLSPGTNGGSPITVTNTGTCGDVQFFNPGSNTATVGPGWSMTIGSAFSTNPADDLPGQVLRFHGTGAAEAWTVASGSDTARLGVTGTPRNFTANGYYNLEGYSKRYGNFVEGAAVCPELLNEIWAYARALRAVRKSSGTYTAKPSFGGTAIANVVAAGENYGFPSGGGTNVAYGTPTNLNVNGTPFNVSVSQTCNGVSGTIYTGNDATQAVAAKFACAESRTTSDGAAPFATAGGSYTSGAFAAGGLNAATTASYIRVIGLAFCRDVASPRVDYYGWGQTDAGDDPEQAATCTGTNTGSTTFHASGVALLLDAWSKMTSGSSTSGSATSALIGSLTQPEFGAFPACGSPPVGTLFSGWYLAKNQPIAVYDFGLE